MFATPTIVLKFILSRNLGSLVSVFAAQQHFYTGPQLRLQAQEPLAPTLRVAQILRVVVLDMTRHSKGEAATNGAMLKPTNGTYFAPNN